ncbi:Arc family DNA-binding protein [Paracoccus simplex]|uniref:Arc family DNA-binding protein n=1 Tax=Paracoccus simplex TaxID=2086346 RepID=A0ABV7S3Q4_9RHOB
MLRLPDGWRDQLKKEAQQNGRSMNAEIVQRLRPTLEAADARRPQS